MFLIPYSTREFVKRLLFPYVNVTIVLLNVGIFIYQIYMFAALGEGQLAGFIGQYAAVPATITDSTPLEPSLLTSMFLHGGLLHLVGNMMYLLPFGDNIEDRIGHIKYLLFYVLCGVAATAGFSLLNAESTTPLLGASGAIAGVLGGYIVLHPRGVVRGLLFIIVILTKVEIPAIIFVGYWFVLQIFSSVASINTGTAEETGGVAYSAHIIGFIAGVVLMPLMLLISPKRKEAFAASSESD